MNLSEPMAFGVLLNFKAGATYVTNSDTCFTSVCSLHDFAEARDIDWPAKRIARFLLVAVVVANERHSVHLQGLDVARSNF